MKIPLDFDKERTRVSVVASIRFESRTPIPVLFVVDTGSPVTFVDEFVSSKARVFTKNLKFDHFALMGGTKIAVHDAGGVNIGFKGENGALVQMPFDAMKVTKSEWKRKEAIYSSVSIIGLDFLLENKLVLYINPAKRMAYLEDM